MGTQLRVLVILGSMISLVVIVNMIKKEKLELKYSLSWIFASIAILFMGIFPKGIDFIAKILNIANPMNALFFTGICFILIILFSLTVAQSRSSRKIKDLAQKIALLEHELINNRVDEK